MRLDIYLTKHFNIQSRNKASELIKNEKVKINDKIITKLSFKVDETMNITLHEDEFFVSRAAYKLKYFLNDLNLELKNKTALDIGSSTGGFTQILLKNDVFNVTCVDVGTNQLHESIKYDKRIIKKENTDIRKFKSSTLYDIVTCDVSFISIINILKNIDGLSKKDIIILYKPQFEVGTNVKRNRAGVVQDNRAILKSRAIFIEETKKYNWYLKYCKNSQLSGKNGNIEELFYFTKR